MVVRVRRAHLDIQNCGPPTPSNKNTISGQRAQFWANCSAPCISWCTTQMLVKFPAPSHQKNNALKYATSNIYTSPCWFLFPHPAACMWEQQGSTPGMPGKIPSLSRNSNPQWTPWNRNEKSSTICSGTIMKQKKVLAPSDTVHSEVKQIFILWTGCGVGHSTSIIPKLCAKKEQCCFFFACLLCNITNFCSFSAKSPQQIVFSPGRSSEKPFQVPLSFRFARTSLRDGFSPTSVHVSNFYLWVGCRLLPHSSLPCKSGVLNWTWLSEGQVTEKTEGLFQLRTLLVQLRFKL